MELRVEGEIIFDGSGEFATHSKMVSLFSYVVGKRQVLTKAELAEELAGEP